MLFYRGGGFAQLDESAAKVTLTSDDILGLGRVIQGFQASFLESEMRNH
jgi:hypothetical protein